MAVRCEVELCTACAAKYFPRLQCQALNEQAFIFWLAAQLQSCSTCSVVGDVLALQAEYVPPCRVPVGGNNQPWSPL